MKEHIQKISEEHLQSFKESLENNAGKIEVAVNMIVDCYNNKGKVILMGNGGSAADAQHIAGELVGRFKKERGPLPALSLGTNASVISALANDYGFDKVFERQVEAFAKSEDVVIGFSTSGNSENVVRAILRARGIGAKTISFIGKGGKLRDISDIFLAAESSNTPVIQEIHIAMGHIICGLVEQEIFKES